MSLPAFGGLTPTSSNPLPGSPPQALAAERTHHSAKMRRINANPASGALQFYPIRGILKGGNPTSISFAVFDAVLRHSWPLKNNC